MPDNIMPSWEEWSELSQEQRDYSLFRTLGSIDGRLMDAESGLDARTVVCGKRFKGIENQRLFNKAVSFLGGIFGGAAVVIGKYIFK